MGRNPMRSRPSSELGPRSPQAVYHLRRSTRRVSAFPTTWFIAPDGRIEFARQGWSEKLVERLGWRVPGTWGPK